MNIEKNLDGSVLVLKPIGMIDVASASELEDVITDFLSENDINELIFDFSEVTYISSACLRVVLYAQKQMPKNSMRVKNIAPEVRKVFDLSGFSSFLNLE